MIKMAVVVCCNTPSVPIPLQKLFLLANGFVSVLGGARRRIIHELDKPGLSLYIEAFKVLKKAAAPFVVKPSQVYILANTFHSRIAISPRHYCEPVHCEIYPDSPFSDVSNDLKLTALPILKA